jgi:hypothetical protein
MRSSHTRLARNVCFYSATLALLACSSSSSSPVADGGALPSATRPDLDRMATGGDCTQPTGPGTTHRGDVVADEAWRAADGPHRVEGELRVLADVTVEACAVVSLGEGAKVFVGNRTQPGSLRARGSYASGKLLPVVFRAQDAAKPWAAIVVDASGNVDLAYTVLLDGDTAKNRGNDTGVLRAFGAPASNNAPPALIENVRVEWLLVERSGGDGVSLADHAAFTRDSRGLAVRAAKLDALRIELGAVSSVPPELVFAGNQSDKVTVDQTGAGTLSHTFRNHGVPYRVLGMLTIQPVVDGPPAVMTIEPGAVLEFAEDKGASGVFFGASPQRQGQIIAEGTADAPIRFTSNKAAPAPGDWMGLYFRHSPPRGNVIRDAIIEYAGGNSSSVGAGCGPSDNDASVLLSAGRPDTAFIQRTTFRKGGGATGIVSGWTSDQDGPDFKTGNVFEDMPGCQVSKWGPCPSGGPTCL